MSIPFFSIDFTSDEWRVFLSSHWRPFDVKKQNEEQLKKILQDRFPDKKITLFPSARMAFYFVLKNTFSSGDEVIFPAMGFPLYVKIALQLGLRPKFVDVESKHYTIDYLKLKEAITPNVKGIVVTHLFGHPCQMDEIMKIANDKGLKVIEDAAQSFDSFYKERETGTFGYAGVFSCSLMKVPTTLGGGILLTDDVSLHNNIDDELSSKNYSKKIHDALSLYIKNTVSILNSFPLIYTLFTHHVFGLIKKRNPSLLRKVLYSGMGLMSNEFNPWERPKLAKYQLYVGNVQFARTREMTKRRIEHSDILDKILRKSSSISILPCSEYCFWNRQYHVIKLETKEQMNYVFNDMFDKGFHLMKEDVWDCTDYEFSSGIASDCPVSQIHTPTLLRVPNNSMLTYNTIQKIATELVKSSNKYFKDRND
jgi:dTDP-4-amino-4,6-dideoxygalactose transaminase